MFVNKCYLCFTKKYLATQPAPSTTTQPVPTHAPDQLPYRATADYVWSNFNNNATSIIECGTSHNKTDPSFGTPKSFDPNCKVWGGPRCNIESNRKKICLGNGPLGMGTSVILRNTSIYASSKVTSLCTFITYISMCNIIYQKGSLFLKTWNKKLYFQIPIVYDR